MAKKLTPRQKRKFRIRNRISGSSERPRLTVFRSAKHIYAQVIDDEAGATMASVSTLSLDLRSVAQEGTKVDVAQKVGALLAKVCIEKQIEKVVFDRNGYLYHGRIKALAEAARGAGLKF